MREPSSKRGSLDERIDAMTKRHLITTPFTPAARDVAWHVAAAFSSENTKANDPTERLTTGTRIAGAGNCSRSTWAL